MRAGRSPNNENDEDNPGNDDSAVDEDSNGHFVMSESDMIYSVESFGAVVIPVTITMVLSALTVVFVNTDETIAAGEQAYANIYQVYDVGDDEALSSLQKLGRSLVNTLVMVSVICVMTFVVVLCYKFRCMKIFYAYMVVAMASLLGYFTSNILLVAMSIYPWMSTDKLTFAFLMYNYAVVGTVAIFLPRGIPKWVTQGYLIGSSVCLAWQLSYFGSWMAWTLLVMLALYDLFAVLSPYGPLKALAELVSKDGAPALPGLLYEATLPSGVSKSDRKNKRRRKEAMRSGEDNGSEEHGNESFPNHGGIENNDNSDAITSASGNASSMRNVAEHRNDNEPSIKLRKDQPLSGPHQKEGNRQGEQQTEKDTDARGEPASGRGQTTRRHSSAIENSLNMSNHGQVPLALAKIYTLTVWDVGGVLGRRSIEQQQDRNHRIEDDDSSGTNDLWQRQDPVIFTAEEIRSMNFTEQQLGTEVTCVFPPRGGKIVRARSRDQTYDVGTAYIVYDRRGNEKRKFVVTPQGSVMEVVRRESSPENDNETNNEADNSTIKLGLGDFIFYSVLVSKAAQYSFTAFATCLLVVLWGLAATLVILAIRGKALPALPISIFLGVIVFLWTRSLIQPWVHEFLPLLIYV